MPDISYSTEALNVRNAFFNVKSIIYVEGDDDVLFWQDVFSRVTQEEFEIEAVGGSTALDEYIKKIDSGQLYAIAARDADFLSIQGLTSTNPRVIYTFGHSIENSLYTSSSINQLVRLWCKSSRIAIEECTKWLNDFAETVKILVYLDVANSIAAAGLQTLGENCSRYMVSTTSAAACAIKIGVAAEGISAKIPSGILTSASISVGLDSAGVLKYMRGHFLASAVHRYVVNKAKSHGKKVSISSESLYAAAIVQFARTLDGEHPHKDHYIKSALTAWNSV